MNLIMFTFRTPNGIDTIIVHDNPNMDLCDIMQPYPYTADDILTDVVIPI